MIRKVGTTEDMKKAYPDAEYIDAKAELSCQPLLMPTNIFIALLPEA